jgi:hypothetical protein
MIELLSTLSPLAALAAVVLLATLAAAVALLIGIFWYGVYSLVRNWRDFF